MPRYAKELGALAVAKIVEPGLHFVGGVQGLGLHVTRTGARSWLLRAMVAGRRREMGLGSFPGVTLAAARERARNARDSIDRGVDPIAEKAAAVQSLRAAAASVWTFERCATAYIEAHESGWKNVKHAQQWRNTLETYAFPTMGHLQVADVDLPHVLAVLEPIWRTKTETASRLRGRIESVLDWAKGRRYRTGDNPAAWKGNLDAQLPHAARVMKRDHHAALPAVAMGPFMTRLRAADGMGARALEFAILTAARSGEVRGARLSEIDRDAAVWTVPSDRMKAGREHRVPLSAAALNVIDRAAGEPRTSDTDLVFPAASGAALSDMTLTAVLRRMDVAAVPHGFRSTFRDWAAEATDYPRDAAEMALAHTIGDKVEAAYRRGDLFEKRRSMMADWAAFLGAARPTAA